MHLWRTTAVGQPDTLDVVTPIVTAVATDILHLPQADSLAATVVAKAAARDGGGGSATLQYSMSRRVPLSGRELADYYEAAEQVNMHPCHCICRQVYATW